MAVNAEARDRLQQESMSRLHSESSEYASMLRNSESGSFEESAAFYRYSEIQRKELMTYEHEAAEARSIAHEAVTRVHATEEMMRGSNANESVLQNVKDEFDSLSRFVQNLAEGLRSSVTEIEHTVGHITVQEKSAGRCRW